MKPPKVFAKNADLPKLKLELVEQACASITAGAHAYRSVLYLCFARAHDVDTLFQASQSEDVNERWQRLWVLAPFITKLSRSPNGRAAIALNLRADLPALNLLGKFEEQRHPSVRRLFSRMRDELLDILLDAIVASHQDERRAAILAKLIALLETGKNELEARLKPRIGDPEKILRKLILKDPVEKKFDPQALRQKLEQLGPAFSSGDEQ